MEEQPLDSGAEGQQWLTHHLRTQEPPRPPLPYRGGLQFHLDLSCFQATLPEEAQQGAHAPVHSRGTVTAEVGDRNQSKSHSPQQQLLSFFKEQEQCKCVASAPKTALCKLWESVCPSVPHAQLWNLPLPCSCTQSWHSVPSPNPRPPGPAFAGPCQ